MARGGVVTRKLGAVGDVNPIEHGGGFILGGEKGTGGPWLEYSYGISDWPESWDVDLDDPKWLNRKVTLYRIDLAIDGESLMADLNWVDWDSVSTACGYSDDDPWSNLRTAQQRASAVMDVAGYYGWHELDNYPLELTLFELIERWRKYL
jgi:hypothetical protein